MSSLPFSLHLLARYRESGPLALANRRCGLRGNRQLVPGLAELALGIIRDNYADFELNQNPCQAIKEYPIE